MQIREILQLSVAAIKDFPYKLAWAIIPRGFVRKTEDICIASVRMVTSLDRSTAAGRILFITTAEQSLHKNPDGDNC